MTRRSSSGRKSGDPAILDAMRHGKHKPERKLDGSQHGDGPRSLGKALSSSGHKTTTANSSVSTQDTNRGLDEGCKVVRDGQVGRLDSQGYPGLVFNQTNLTFVLKQRETETTERSSINNTGLAGAASEGTARLTVLRPQVVHSRQRMGSMGSPWDKAGSREGSTMDTTLEKR